MARGTDFGGVHSHRDLHLIQPKVEVQPAEPKLNLIEVPGADCSKDLSTHPAGRVTFNDREITWTFALYPGENWDAKHSQVSGALNGRYCQIILDTDPGYYYLGRLVVSKHKVDGLLRQITVKAQCRPYKLRQQITRAFIPFCGKNLVDPASLEQVAGAGTTLTILDTGIRAVWINSTGSYAVMKVFPLQMLIGKTITLSATITEFGKGRAYLRMGYASSDGKTRVVKVNLQRTGSVTLTVQQEDPRHEWLALWFYASYDQDATGATAGDYVEYTNLQLEMGSRATEYEKYAAAPGPLVYSLLNERKPVVPTIVCTGETTLTMGGTSVVLNEGTHKILDFEFSEGTNQVTLQGTGAAAIIYQEGAL